MGKASKLLLTDVDGDVHRIVLYLQYIRHPTFIQYDGRLYKTAGSSGCLFYHEVTKDFISQQKTKEYSRKEFNAIG
jgi:hypothetical protein